MTTRHTDSPLARAVIPETPPSGTSLRSDTTYLMDNDEQVTDHLLTNVLRLPTPAAADTKLWLTSHGSPTFPLFLETMQYDPQVIHQHDFEVGNIKG